MCDIQHRYYMHFFTKTPGIIEPSYLNKYLEKLREPYGERNFSGEYYTQRCQELIMRKTISVESWKDLQIEELEAL